MYHIWHPSLIDKLCNRHLRAAYDNAFKSYDIILRRLAEYTMNLTAKVYKDRPQEVWNRMKLMREELIQRGKRPKKMLPKIYGIGPRPVDDMAHQLSILNQRSCTCNKMLKKTNSS